MHRHKMIAMLIFLSTLLPSVTQAQEYAVRPQFEFAGHFHDGLAPVMKGGLWGFIDVAGNWVIEPKFNAVKAGSDRRFGVQMQNKWGYIDSAGKLTIRFRFKEASRFSEGMATVSENGREFFVIDTEGNDTNKGNRFSEISLMRGGIATLKNESDEWTILSRGSVHPAYSSYLFKENPDAPGNALAKIEDLTRFSEGLAFMLNEGAYRVVRHNQYNVVGAFSMPDGTRNIDHFPTFKSVRHFSNGLAAVSADGVSWGFIDHNARFVITPTYEAAREFTEGVAPVKIGGLWGYVDRSGKVVFPPTYDRAYSFREGFATTRKGDLRGFLQIRSGGQITNVYPPQFEDVYSFQEGLAPIKTGGLWGFIKIPGINLRVLPPIRQETVVQKLLP